MTHIHRHDWTMKWLWHSVFGHPQSTIIFCIVENVCGTCGAAVAPSVNPNGGARPRRRQT